MSIQHRNHEPQLSRPLTPEEIAEADKSRSSRRKIVAGGALFAVVAGGGGVAYGMTAGGESAPAPNSAPSTNEASVPTLNTDPTSAAATQQSIETGTISIPAGAAETAEQSPENSLSSERIAEINAMSYEQFKTLDSKEQTTWAVTEINADTDNIYPLLNQSRTYNGLPSETTPYVPASETNTSEEIMTRLYIAAYKTTSLYDKATWERDTESGKKMASGWLTGEALTTFTEQNFSFTKSMPNLTSELPASDQYTIIGGSENIQTADGLIQREIILESNPNNKSEVPYISLTLDYDNVSKAWLVRSWNDFNNKPSQIPN